MKNKDIILKDEFFKSKEFKEWHDSYVSAIIHALEPTKKFIKKWEDTYGKLPKLEPLNEDDPWVIKTKEEIMNLRSDLLFKSIELGLYFKELEDKQ